MLLEYNPNLMASQAEIRLAEGGVLYATSDFNTTLSGRVDRSVDRYSNTIDERMGRLGYDPEASYRDARFSYSVGASKLLKSGTIVEPGIGFTNYGKNSLFQELEAAGYGAWMTNRASVSLNVRQPLLLGRGKEYNTAGIRIAEKEVEISKQYFAYEVSRQLANALVSYADYIYESKNLEIQLDNEMTYKKLVRDMERLVQLDNMPEADLLYIKSNYMDQVNSRTYAENSLEYARNTLRARLGLPHDADTLGLPPSAFPVTELEMEEDAANVIYWIDQSLSKRPDYQAALQVIEQLSIDKTFQQQSRKPQLDLVAGMGYNGIYESNGPDQFVKPYWSNIPGMSYSVGIRMSIQPAFDAVDGQLMQIEAQVDREKANLIALENEIELNVKRYYDRVRFFQQVVATAQESAKLNARALENEKKKLKLSMSTVINVVQIQNDYIGSLIDLNRALQDLNIAIILYKFHIGALTEVDEDGNIRIDTENLFSIPTKPE
jgi:outer membrane protein TolC